MHRWVAEALHPYQGEQLDQRHERAVEMHLRRIEHGRWTFDDLTETCRHLAATRRFDDLAAFALQAANAGIGQLAVAALLGQVVPTMPPDHPFYVYVANREVQALLLSGNTTAANARLTTTLQLTTGQGQANPGDSEAQRDLSFVYTSLGDLLRTAGDTKSRPNASSAPASPSTRNLPRPTRATPGPTRPQRQL